MFSLRMDEMEIFWPTTSTMLDFIEDVADISWKSMDPICSSWRQNLAFHTQNLKDGTPDWFSKDLELLGEPMLSTLLMNPHYSKLAESAARINDIIALVPTLHSDGCQVVFDPAALQVARRARDDGVDTVTLTYALYQCTHHIPSLATEKEKHDAATSVLQQIESKNYTLPDAVESALRGFQQEE